MGINRRELVAKKAREIAKELGDWAEKEKLLGPGERIVFSMEIERSPCVIRNPGDSTDVVVLRDMPAEKFFTRERLERAGGKGRLVARATNLIQRMVEALKIKSKKEPYRMSDFLLDVPDWHHLAERLDGKSGRLVMAAIVQTGLEFGERPESQNPQ